MNFRRFLKACALSSLINASGTAAPTVTGDTFVEARQAQSLGLFRITANASFIIYEWQRPYGWTPDDRGVAATVVKRPLTRLYRVRTPDTWGGAVPPTSFEFFPPKPGATYWLGDISPDGQWASFYELDADDNALRAGIAKIDFDAPSQLIRFDLPPDNSRLDRAPAWSSDGTALTYPIKGGVARADVATGRAVRCGDCAEPPVAKPTPVPFEIARKVDRGHVPKEAKLIAASRDGALGVFVLDNKDTLNVYYTKAKKTVTLFENSRH
jgi:hypothetical protein